MKEKKLTPENPYVEQLVQQARSGNEVAATELYERYRKTVLSAVFKTAAQKGIQRNNGVDWEDFLSAGYEGLVGAIQTHKPASAPFGYLVFRCAREKVLTTIQKQRRLKRTIATVISLDQPILNSKLDGSKDTSLHELIGYDEKQYSNDYAQLVGIISSILQKRFPQHRNTLLRLINGERQRVIATELGVAPSQICTVWNNFKKTLWKELDCQGYWHDTLPSKPLTKPTKPNQKLGR